MRHCAWAIAALVGFQSTATATPNVDTADLRMLRIEGAAVDVRRAAEDVEETARNISNSKYLNGFTTLTTQLDTLNRMVISARMAVNLAHDEVTASELK